MALFASAARGSLDTSSVRTVASAHACTVVLASKGYPDAFEKGYAISGIPEALTDARIGVYHAGVALTSLAAAGVALTSLAAAGVAIDGVATKDAVLVTSGGRVLAVTAVAASLGDARMAAYEACDHIHFEGKTLRRDIAQRAFKTTA